MLTAQIETLNEGLEELKAALLDAHYNELSEHKNHGYPLNPNYSLYLQMENEGKVLYITLRKEGKLVGYFVGFITNCLHYQISTLSLDIMYVANDERGKRGGLILINAIKKEFRRRNIKLWRMGSKSKFEAATGHQMDRLLNAIGFEEFETVYALWA